MIIVTEAKDIKPCVNILRKPSPIKYPYLFNFITVVPIHSVTDQVAAVNGDDTLGECVDQFLLVGYHQNGSTHLVYLLKQEHQLKAAHRVEVAGRLISDDHGRIVDKRPCNGNTLLLAAGKLGRQALFTAVKTDELQTCGTLAFISLFDAPTTRIANATLS